MAQRIQLRRTKGWRIPENAVVVSRPSKWGNPFKAGGDAAPFAAIAAGGRGDVPRDRAHGVVCLYVRWLAGAPIECTLTALMAHKEHKRAGSPPPPTSAEIRKKLRGKDLACWCALDKPCHADVLLEIANT